MKELIDRIVQMSPGRKVGLLFLVVFIVAALYHMFVYSPRSVRIAGLEEEIEKARSERDKKLALVTDLPKLREESRRLQGMLRYAVARLPEKREIPELLSSISGRAREAGLEILRFRPRAENLQEFYAEIPVDIVVRGGFTSVVSFFDEVGKLSRLVNIRNISIGNPQVQDGSVSVDTSSQATTFRFLDEAERARIAAQKEAAKKSGRRR